jgi:non-ribosomal peptide synthetase component F
LVGGLWNNRRALRSEAAVVQFRASGAREVREQEPGGNIVNTDSSFRRFPFDPVHPHVPFTDHEIEQSIPERFEQQVRAAGDRLAIKSPERSFTYVELNQTANRLARKILSLRGERAEAIALMFDHGASILAAILAVLKTGKFYLVLDPTYPRERLAYMLADSGASEERVERNLLFDHVPSSSSTRPSRPPNRRRRLRPCGARTRECPASAGRTTSRQDVR